MTTKQSVGLLIFLLWAIGAGIIIFKLGFLVWLGVAFLVWSYNLARDARRLF